MAPSPAHPSPSSSHHYIKLHLHSPPRPPQRPSSASPNIDLSQTKSPTTSFISPSSSSPYIISIIHPAELSIKPLHQQLNRPNRPEPPSPISIIYFITKTTARHSINNIADPPPSINQPTPAQIINQTLPSSSIRHQSISTSISKQQPPSSSITTAITPSEITSFLDQSSRPVQSPSNQNHRPLRLLHHPSSAPSSTQHDSNINHKTNTISTKPTHIISPSSSQTTTSTSPKIAPKSNNISIIQ